MDKKKDYSNKFIFFFFIFVVCIFTAINLMEFLKQAEPDGRVPGLGNLITVKDDAVTYWGGIQKFLGKTETYGSTDYENVVNLGDGYYVMPDPDASIEAGKAGVTQGMEMADDLDVPFLYVLTPPKQEVDDEDAGIVDYALSKYQSFSKWLSDNQIPAIDMGEVFYASGEDYKSFFYKTDHHSNNKGTFLMYQTICGWMKDEGFSINDTYVSEGAYNIVHYDDVFLGSSGRMAGPLYTGLDDYDLYLPVFDTDYTLETVSQGISRTGDFENSLVYYENLEGYSYDYYAYYAYLHEDYDITSIINNGNPEGPHIVMLRDSSSVPVSCFLASQCSRIDLISLRYVADKSVIKDYIKVQDPDLIIYMYAVGFLGNEASFVF